MRATDSNEQRWKALASAAFSSADYMTDPDSKELMYTIARSYDKLAKRAAELEAISVTLGKAPLHPS
jgi:hypothetical protein